MKTMLLIDGDHLAYRNYFKLNNLSYKGHLTGCLFGSLNSIIAIMNEFEIKPIVFWSCGKQEYWRKQEYPDYKEGRKRVEMPDFHQQINDLTNFLSAVGIEQVKCEGIEADDAIATFVDYFQQSDIYIYSGDKDFLQLVSNHVSVVHPQKGLYNEVRVIEEFGFIPKLIPDFLAIIGDKSDNIPGVMGVGEKTAKVLVSQLGAIENWHKIKIEDREEIFKKYQSKIEKILDQWDDLLNSKILIELLPPVFSIKDIKSKNFLEVDIDYNLANYILQKNGITSIRINNFKEV